MGLWRYVVLLRVALGLDVIGARMPAPHHTLRRVTDPNEVPSIQGDRRDDPRDRSRH